jgi:D-alanyl-lipoteichoic acid acyltransferase DltB (MBOAT superfamily)
MKVLLFWTGVTLNLAVLVGIRYFSDFIEVLYVGFFGNDIKPSVSETNIFLTIGVSFYVFQAISYLIDVYIEIEEPERHIGYFALYMCFFAKLLQGPIERSNELLPQLKAEKSFNKDNLYAGIFLFTWGLFKKVVVADRLSLFVDTVYDDVYSYSGLQLILATYYYSLQIYFDFSGYTDMALGTARMFGINLTQNFNSPYFATSIADFWRRWHISLSRWILDYIFKPLQMQFRNYKNLGAAFALIITFLVCGAWHGLSWGFILWGFIHGMYMAISIYYGNIKKYIFKTSSFEKTKLRSCWQILFTFNIVSFSWIFFRSRSLSEAYYVVSHLFSDITQTFQSLFSHEALKYVIVFNNSRLEFLIVLMGLAIVTVIHMLRNMTRYKNIDIFLGTTPYWMKWSLYYSLFMIIIIFMYDTTETFIYFRF